jgi:hypothetical protein
MFGIGHNLKFVDGISFSFEAGYDGKPFSHGRGKDKCDKEWEWEIEGIPSR